MEFTEYLATKYDPWLASIERNMVQLPGSGQALPLVPALLGVADQAPSEAMYAESWPGAYVGSPVWRPTADLILSRDPAFEPVWQELSSVGSWDRFRDSREFQPVVEQLGLRARPLLKKGAKLVAKHGGKVWTVARLPTHPVGAVVWLGTLLLEDAAVAGAKAGYRAIKRELKERPANPLPVYPTRPMNPADRFHHPENLALQVEVDPFDSPFVWLDHQVARADRWLDNLFVKMDDWLL